MLLVALLASKSCARTGGDVSKEQAIAIAERQVDYEPDRTQVRLIRRGAPQSRPYWAVSLSTVDRAGGLDRVTVVVVDARTKAVTEVRESGR